MVEMLDSLLGLSIRVAPDLLPKGKNWELAGNVILVRDREAIEELVIELNAAGAKVVNPTKR